MIDAVGKSVTSVTSPNNIFMDNVIENLISLQMILIFKFRISKDRLEGSAIADFCGSDDNNFHNLFT